jgi:PAS domain S-box-containing protein
VSEKDKRLMMPTVPPWDLVAEQIPHVVWVTDAEGSLEYLNRRGHDLVGLTPEEMSGWGRLRVVHPNDAANARDTWESAIRDGTTYQMEYRVRTLAGDYRWMVAEAAPLRGSDGQIFGWAGTWTDVDDLKRLQDQLGGARTPPAASLAVLEALQATTPLGIGVVDRDLRIVHMNEVLGGLDGFSSEDVEGRMLAEVSTIWPQVGPVYQQVLHTGEAVANVTVERRTADGQPSHWLHSFCPLRMATEMTGIVMVGIEVTEHRRDETFRSVVLEKVVEGLNLAQLIGGLAHDLDDRFDAILDHLDSEDVAAALGDHTSADRPLAANVGAVQPHLDRPGQPTSELTPRELEVLHLVASGLTNRDIAAQLYLSLNTIRGHVQHILDKLGAHSKLEAVAIAARQGLVHRQT